ncbi:MAG: nucleotidyl transferase AbiEii/AbiGii toxin family protein [candidate division KSB1 bacterium]|nr:nucleotidyl transferase AbiEii/AbiGii toxin family protein [candidate division KSB1 bacterium]
MKDQAKQIIQSAQNRGQARLLLREYIQHVILRQLFEQKILQRWIFHGGTALRILHKVNRFSEYLDFHADLSKAQPELSNMIDSLVRGLKYQGYSVSTRLGDENAIVFTAMIKFKHLLYELGLSAHADENLSVKIECDTRPPSGYNVDQSLINTYFPIGLRHHDLSSFLSGKLHAILQRAYTKGRDFYDVMFLLSRWRDLNPNFKYLNHALKQTQYAGPKISRENWKNILRQTIQQRNWRTIVADVEPFLESNPDLQMFTKEHLLTLL